MRGRKPQAIAPGSSPIRDVPKPPAWLSPDARKEWRHLAPILVERGHLTDADLGILANCCDAFGTVVEMARQIARDGAVFVTSDGMMKRNPATGIKNEAATRHRQLCTELGLSPTSRSRPSMRDDREDDDVSPLDL